MRRRMDSVQDLVEEAKVRTVWWAICVFGVAFFLSHTSKSTWANIPIAFLIFVALRLLSYEVEFRWRVRPIRKPTYLSHLQKKQLRLDDPRLSTFPFAPSWKRKIDSPLVEAAMDDFIGKILKDFVIDLWYSAITPDLEFPEQIRIVICGALGEVSRRLKEINLVDLLTRDMVELVGNHIDLYRRNQAAIGIDVMGTLSFDERDERLKHHLLASKELHPALISPDCEYKVLQRLMSGVLGVALKPQEGPLVRSIARELLTCLVMQPVMNFACPGYVNELIEYIFLSMKDNGNKEVGHDSSVGSSAHDQPVGVGMCQSNFLSSKDSVAPINQQSDMLVMKYGSQDSAVQEMHSKPADWARKLDAVTQRRTQVLAPENLENLWSKGRNYNKRSGYQITRVSGPTVKISENVKRKDHSLGGSSQHLIEGLASTQICPHEQDEDARQAVKGNVTFLKRSSSSPALENEPSSDIAVTARTEEAGASKDFHGSSLISSREDPKIRSASDLMLHGEGSQHFPKLKCRVLGAYFEKTGSKSFAVYSIAVTDADNKTWFVKRRYRNFERLHRHLKEIPNYLLHLPPKRFLSSSIDDQFVHQRCVLLDKYLQDLLSIANVAEQHEVWDFLSASSKNYSFGKSTSVMKSLAVNVDDAVDDIVRQFKGVSDGLLRKVSGTSSVSYTASSITERNLALSWNEDEGSKHSPRNANMATSQSFSDNEEGKKNGRHNEVTNGWHSDNELNTKSFPPRVVKHFDELGVLASERSHPPEEIGTLGWGRLTSETLVRGDFERSITVPPEWSPSKVSVPLLNLVDKIFQLNRRGWLRRQVYWISKQILQLMMEDALDDWLLNQIQLLRRDDIIAQGIRWVSDILWPNGTFFLKLELSNQIDETLSSSNLPNNASRVGGRRGRRPESFESHLEAARRASDVKKILLGGAPAALVSLIGQRQYQRCSKDIYFFLQSTICLKQLAYCMLELIILSIFPELQNLVQDIHEKTHLQSI